MTRSTLWLAMAGISLFVSWPSYGDFVLTNDSSRVKSSASSRALSPEERALFREQLSDPAESRQAEALRDLERRTLGAGDVEWLLDCYRGAPATRGAQSRMNCVYLLGRTHDPRAVPVVVEELRSPRRNKAECLLALARIGDPRAVPAVIEFLANAKEAKGHPPIGTACYALGQLKDASAIPSLLAQVGYSGRVFAEWDLLQFGDAAVDPVLVAVSNTPNAPLVFTLGELRKARAVPLLSQLAVAEQAKEGPALSALYALRKINSPEAINVLRSAASSTIDETRRQLAARLAADATNAVSAAVARDSASIVAQASNVASAQVSVVLHKLDELIESFDVPWSVKDRARDRAERLRLAHRYRGEPQTWDSVAFIVRTVEKPDGTIDTASDADIEAVRGLLVNITSDVDRGSQGQLACRLQTRVIDDPVSVSVEKSGRAGLDRRFRKELHEERVKIGADHQFLFWFPPKGMRMPPPSNGGAYSQCPVKRDKAGKVRFVDGPLHEMIHSMNNCLYGAGYERGQLPGLHHGVAQLTYRAGRDDGTTAPRERLVNYMRRYFTGQMWKDLSRSDLRNSSGEDDAGAEEYEPDELQMEEDQ